MMTMITRAATPGRYGPSRDALAIDILPTVYHGNPACRLPAGSPTLQGRRHWEWRLPKLPRARRRP